MLALVVALALVGSDVQAAATKGAQRRAPRPVAAEAVTVPIDVGVGVIGLFPNPGPILDDQLLHGGITLSLAAVIDRELLRAHADRIPASLRRAARGLDEVRLRPWYLALVPELLIVSPQLKDTGMYGAIWRPVGLGANLVDEPVRVSVNAALDVAYVFVHSQSLGGGTPAAPSFTHVVRPGLNLSLEVEVPLSDTLLVSTGWSSDLLVPQPLGRAPWELVPLDEALWHLGGPFVALHVRIPFQTRL